jgi:hypothetical protein
VLCSLCLEKLKSNKILKMVPIESYRISTEKFDRNLAESMRNMRRLKLFFDVKIGCKDENGNAKFVTAHKVVLASCSPVLRQIFEELEADQSTKQPLVFLQEVSYEHFCQILETSYTGVLSVPENPEAKKSFLKAVEALKVDEWYNKLIRSSSRPDNDLRSGEVPAEVAARPCRMSTSTPRRADQVEPRYRSTDEETERIKEMVSIIYSPIHGTNVPTCHTSGRELTDPVTTVPKRPQLEEQPRPRQEKQRLLKQQQEQQRLLKQQQEKQRLMKELQEQQKLLKQQQEKQRLMKEQQEQQKLLKQQQEKQRLMKEQQEKQKLLKQQQEKQRLMKEQQEKQKLLKQQQEKQRLLKQQEQQRLLKQQQVPKKLLKKQQQEQQRLVKQSLEQERRLKDQQERQRLLKQHLEQQPLLKQQQQQQRSLKHLELLKQQMELANSVPTKRKLPPSAAFRESALTNSKRPCCRKEATAAHDDEVAHASDDDNHTEEEESEDRDGAVAESDDDVQEEEEATAAVHDDEASNVTDESENVVGSDDDVQEEEVEEEEGNN